MLAIEYFFHAPTSHRLPVISKLPLIELLKTTPFIICDVSNRRVAIVRSQWHILAHDRNIRSLEPDTQRSSYIPVGEFDVCTRRTVVETVQLAEDTNEVSVPGKIGRAHV